MLAYCLLLVLGMVFFTWGMFIPFPTFVFQLAWEYGMPFFETSAKENVNIEHAFSVLTKEILEKVGFFSKEKEDGRFFLTDWVDKLVTTE